MADAQKTCNTCPECGAEMSYRDCRRCDGAGEIEDDDPINGPEPMRCPDCFGRGEILDCPYCYDEDLL